MRLRFTRRQRLQRKMEFEAVFASGRRFHDAMFTVIMYRAPRAEAVSSQRPRLGLAISARSIGGAVARNRLRRLVRESFRLHQHQLPAADFVVTAKPAARAAPAAALRRSLEALWRRAAHS